MRKGIELPKETIDALLSGASMFIIPIDEKNWVDSVENYINWGNEDVAIENYSPLQIGDEFYVKEVRNVELGGQMSPWGYELKRKVIVPASQMTYEQSRLKDLMVADIRIRRVGEISHLDAVDCSGENSILFMDDFEQFKFQRRKFESIAKDAGCKDNQEVLLITCKKIVAN